jgi:DNA-binding transcriptional regulator GbsR (MarR family)
MGDRRDHYEAETDLLEMVTRIAQGRKEREIDPAAAALRACVAEADGDPQVSPVARERLAEMQRFVETLNRWYDQMLGVPPAKIMALIRMGAKVVNFLSFGRKSEGRDAS